MWNLLRPLATLSLCFVLFACDSVEERAEKHYQSALALIEEGDFERAEIELRNVFQLDGQHIEARTVYAKMLLDMGRPARANAQYLRLAEQLPEDADARRALTLLSMDAQNWAEIERHGNKLIELLPDDPVAKIAGVALAFRDAADAEDAAGQRQAADAAAELVVENPDVSLLRFILIQQAMDDTDLESALAQMDELVALNNDQVELHVMRLQILGSLDRRDEIEESLIGLIDQFPENEEFLPGLLQFYGSQGRVDDAIAFLRGYLEKNPGELQPTNTLIELVTSANGPDAGIAEIDRLASAGFNATILGTQRARIQFEAGDRDEAIAAIEGIVAAAQADVTEDQAIPDDLNTAKIVLSRMLLSTGNEVGARRLVEEVLFADGSNGAALKMQASWLIADDKPDDAVTLLRTTIDNSPDDWEAMLLMADAFTRAGSHELSRDFVSLAVETSNNAPGPSLRFAELLIQEERLILAEETLVDALRVQPDNLQLLITLGRVQVAREDWPRVEQIEGTLRRLGGEEALRVATGFEVTRLASQSRVNDAMGLLEGLASSDGSIQTVAALVRARLANGERDEALAFAEEALAGSPEDPALRLIVASTKVGVGQSDEGRAMLEELLAENDQIEAAWTTLIRLATTEEDLERRDALVAQARAAMPNSVALAWGEASILTEAGDTEAAIAIYEDVYERASTSLLIANNLATLLANTRDDAESLERAYAVARRLRGSEVPAFQDTYGWIAYRRGDPGEALPYLEDAATGLPNDPSVLYHLAVVYQALEREADALKYFNAAVATDGSAAQFPEIALARAEADKLISAGVIPAE